MKETVLAGVISWHWIRGKRWQSTCKTNIYCENHKERFVQYLEVKKSTQEILQF